MKILNTQKLSRPQAYSKIKKFYDLDKKRTSRDGRVNRQAQLSTEKKAQIKGVLKAIKTVSSSIK